MRWHAAWWGTVIVAETDDDEDLLKRLHASLPEKAHVAYENGQLEVGGLEPGDYDDQPARYTLTFHR